MSTHDELRDFALWLNGAVDMTDEAPTPEQWGTIRGRLTEVIGSLMAERMRDAAGKGPALGVLNHPQVYGMHKPAYFGHSTSEAEANALRQYEITKAEMDRVLGMPMDVALGVASDGC